MIKFKKNKVDEFLNENFPSENSEITDENPSDENPNGDENSNGENPSKNPENLNENFEIREENQSENFENPNGENPRGEKLREKNPENSEITSENPSAENSNGEKSSEENPSENLENPENPNGDENPSENLEIREKNPSDENPNGDENSNGENSENPSDENPRGENPENSEITSENPNGDENLNGENPSKNPENLNENFEIREENLIEKNLENFNADSENAKNEKSKVHTLRASSLYKSFGKKQVVKGVDFSMTTGEVLGLLGPNGAGKTTTFYMIVGFYKPTAGDIFLDDECVTRLAMFRRARMGISYLPQEPSVFRKLTVEENIWAILETRKDLSRAQKKRELENLIEEFSIGRIRKQGAYTLSGGERRRTEIARSLAIEPKFLLLDEPFAGIDPIAVSDIKQMIKLLSKRGIGVLITDHNVRDTLEITDRAIIISNGEIITQGGKKEILESEIAHEIYLGKDFSM